MLDLAPFLLGSVLTYFKFAPPPFERILMKRTVHGLSVKVVKHYLDAVRTSYRLLIIEPEIFSNIWVWSCFLDLVKISGILYWGAGAELKKYIADIRWCGVQILSITLRMSDRAILNFGVEAEEALSCLLRWEEFCQDTSLEKAGSYIETKSEEKDVSFNQENCLQCFGLNSLGFSKSREIEPSTRRRRLATRVIWTRIMQRLYFLVKRYYELREPVLLVGETGGGKTTAGQLPSLVLGLKLHILNCHQYTETSDFIGGFYPIRDRSKLLSEFNDIVEQLRSSEALIHYTGDSTISSDIGQAPSTLNKLAAIVKNYRGQLSSAVVTSQDIDMLGQLMLDLGQLHQRWQTIFMWHDGPVVQAMKDGSLFLVDEISLADDCVLERLNSVLEPERKLAHWHGHEAYSYYKRLQRSIIVSQCGWRYGIARRELRMFKMAARETVALIEEKDKFDKCAEELTWRLRLATDLKEAKSQMIVLLRSKVDQLQDSMQRLTERASNLESENQVLRQQALATRPKATIIQRATWNGNIANGEMKEVVDATRPKATIIQRATGNGNIANGEMKKVVDATRPKATIIQRATGNVNIANGEMKKVVDSPGQREVEGANYIFSKMGLKILLLQDGGD